MQSECPRLKLYLGFSVFGRAKSLQYFNFCISSAALAYCIELRNKKAEYVTDFFIY